MLIKQKGFNCTVLFSVPFSADTGACCSVGKLSARAHALRCRESFIFLYAFCDILPHWSLHFLPVLTGRKRSKGRNSRPRPRPEKTAGHYPPRNSLPAVAQTSAPASRQPVKILPCGPVSNGMGRELYQC